MTTEIEEEIALLRLEITRLKVSLAAAFGNPAEFAALGSALRTAGGRLARLEVELRTARFEARDEPWWRNPARRPGGKAVALPKSAAAYRGQGRH